MLNLFTKYKKKEKKRRKTLFVLVDDVLIIEIIETGILLSKPKKCMGTCIQ